MSLGIYIVSITKLHYSQYKLHKHAFYMKINSMESQQKFCYPPSSVSQFRQKRSIFEGYLFSIY